MSAIFLDAIFFSTKHTHTPCLHPPRPPVNSPSWPKPTSWGDHIAFLIFHCVPLCSKYLMNPRIGDIFPFHQNPSTPFSSRGCRRCPGSPSPSRGRAPSPSSSKLPPTTAPGSAGGRRSVFGISVLFISRHCIFKLILIHPACSLTSICTKCQS